MGLPLFVAPVESDVSRKSTQKNGTTSPPRTSIRRVNRSTDRERRNMSRAAARMFGPVQRTLSSIVQDRTPEESLRYITREATRGNERAEESMATVFGSSWYDLPHGPPSDEQNQDPGLIWWSEELNRGQRPRTLTPISSRFTRSPDPLGAARASNSPSMADGAPQATARPRAPRVRLPQVNRNGQHRQGTLRRTAGVDGLGDRERSLSPEGWDTLFTTLTPDPQPPSANTSFASANGVGVAAGTQSTSQSLRQPTAQSAAQPARQSTNRPNLEPATGSSIVPDGFDDRPLDAGCDSGCEHSDLDNADFDTSLGSTLQQRRARARQAQRQYRERIQHGQSISPQLLDDFRTQEMLTELHFRGMLREHDRVERQPGQRQGLEQRRQEQQRLEQQRREQLQRNNLRPEVRREWDRQNRLIDAHTRMRANLANASRNNTGSAGNTNNPVRPRPRRTSSSGRENSEAPNGLERQALNGVPMPDAVNHDLWVGRAMVGANESPASTRTSVNMGSPRAPVRLANSSGGAAEPASGTATQSTEVPTQSSLASEPDNNGSGQSSAETSMSTVAPGDEDWSGMQRIVQSLARRQDIPEEWWAEAGLVRTLSRQGTD